MTKVHSDLRSLSDSLKPEIKRYNDQQVGLAVSDLKSQASMLLGDINALWRGYENSYSPTVYRRTGKTRMGFSLSDVRTTGTGPSTRIEIDLILDDEMMYHDSLFGGSKGHSFMLISEGWDAPGLRAYRGGNDTYRLTTFDGVGIIDSLVNMYNNDKVQFKFYYEGNEYA